MNVADEAAVLVAKAFVHDATGECDFEEFVPGPSPSGDPGAEGWRCITCGETKWYRGPGY